MGTYQVVLAFFSFIAIASAQQAASDTFTVQGQVVNSVTGKPLPRALVQLSSGLAVLTSPEGEFSFDRVPAGPAHITVSKPGFFPLGSRMRGMQAAADASVGPDTGKVLVKLAPEVVISGRVTGRDEEPLEGVQIQVLAPNFYDGWRQIVSIANARTDEDGNYRVAGLPGGRYFIQVNALNAMRATLAARSNKQETYAPLYFPGTPDFASASPVELAAGQHLDVPFSLAASPAFRIAGTVVAAGAWKQINPPMIVDAIGQVLFTVDRYDRNSHAFEFHLPAGSYTLRVNGRDRQDHPVFSEQIIAVTQAVAGLNVALQPGVDIPVVVRTQYSKPPEPCSKSFALPGGEMRHSDCSDIPAAQVELIGLEPSRGHYATDYTPPTDGSSYGLHGVPPGKYIVRIRPRFAGYVQLARCGSADLMREPLIVPQSGGVDTLEVVVRDDAATLKVAVRADKPLEQGLILLVPEGGLFPESRIVGRGRGSEFQYGSIAPGNYKVLAFDSADGIDYNNPEVLAKYASGAATIRVGANENASIAVDVIHTGE